MPATSQRTPNHLFLIAVARAFGGAIIFSLPMLMTMEMWWLGFYAERLRLALFIVVMVPLLIGLSHFVGFEPTFDWIDDTVDAFVALAVGFFAAAVVLLLFDEIGREMSWDEIIGKIAIQAVPGSIGAMLAESQLGPRDEDSEDELKAAGYWGELFFMAVGALFLALNVAPTEEMILIAYKMTPWHALGLVLLSLTIMHAFVYRVEFRGQAKVDPDTSFWSVFLRYTVTGYAIALAISFYVLWIFGRADGTGFEHIVMAAVVMAFPGAIGAAAARLVI
jgi:putative integral membrane protein (TIGR02587 family)